MIIQLNKNLLFKLVVLLGIASYGCDFEDKYVEPCAGKYGSEKVLDSISTVYKKQQCYVYFAEWYKDYNAPKHNSCDTIHLRISFDSSTVISSDTFALSIAKIFFHDTSNKYVSTLNIELGQSSPTIDKEITYFSVSRSNIEQLYLPDANMAGQKMKFKINSDNTFTTYDGKKTREGMKLVIQSERDYRDMEKLAAEAKYQYDSLIKINNWDDFEIEIKPDTLNCKLCYDKIYHFYYQIKEHKFWHKPTNK